MRISWRNLTIVVLLLLLLCGALAAQTNAQRSTRHIYIDQTHEFLFAVDFMGGMLNQQGYDVVISRDTFPPADLDKFDVVLTHQSAADVDYDSESVEAIRRFVENGGGLFMMANYAYFKPTGEHHEMPITKVLSLFGLGLSKKPGQTPVTTTSDPRFGGAVTIDRAPEPPVETLLVTPEAEKLGFKAIAADAGGQPVAGILEYGRGRVAVVTEYALLGKAKSEKEQEFLVKVFDWLSRADEVKNPPATAAGGLVWREPQLYLERNGLKVSYPKPLKKQAEYLLNSFDRVYKAIESFYDVGPAKPLRMEALATGRGAFCSIPLIAIGVMTDLKNIDGYLLWEMTNAWYLPRGPSFVEHWATLGGNVVAEKLGLADKKQIAANIAVWEDILRADDPNLDKFDISLINPDEVLGGKPKKDSTWAHYRMLKQGYIFQKLYDKYGVDIFRRLIKLHRAQYGEELVTPDTDSYYRELSLAAGEDLTPFLRSYGTTVGDLKLPATKEGIRKEARRILDEAARKTQ